MPVFDDPYIPSWTLLLKIDEQGALSQLLEQLNRDLIRANTELQFPLTSAPQHVMDMLRTFIKELLLYRYPDYLNLMYMADVRERSLNALEAEGTDDLAEKILYLLIEREWEKVSRRRK